MGSLLIWNYIGLLETIRNQKITQDTLLSVEYLQDDIHEVEIARHGYLLTGKAGYFNSFIKLNSKIEADLQKLHLLVAVEPQQYQRFKQIKHAIESHVKALKRVLQAKPVAARPMPSTIRQTEQEKQWLDQTSYLLSQIAAEETRQFQRQEQALEQDMRGSIFIGGALAVAIFLILIWLYYTLNREIITRQEAQDALSQSLEREHLAREQAEQANQEKSRILGFVSHDFKNSLAAIARFTEILKRDENTLNTQQKEFLNYISEGIYHLQMLITDILDKAKMEEGQLVPSLEWIDLQAFLQQIKPYIIVFAEPKNIKVSIEIQPGLSGIEADPKFLRQILLNLLSNATKYNKPDGHVSLKIQEAENRSFVQLEVRDTGIGIPAEQIPKLFKPYFRMKKPEREHIEGTGLGLAFIKKLIEIQGGYIVVDSQEGVGSTFTVFLPNPIASLPDTREDNTHPAPSPETHTHL